LFHTTQIPVFFHWLKDRTFGVKAGDRAGHMKKATGYCFLKINGEMIPAHRLAWFYMHGVWPVMIDHKDRVRSNNSLSNLREATPAQNALNASMNSNNSSGMRGVTWNKGVGKWQAQASFNKKSHYLGVFDCPHEAQKAYADFCRERHGEFYAGSTTQGEAA
jgi:hypothetical protein